MTLKQLSEAIGVPESTVRLYRDEFVEFLPATGEGRRRRYGDNSVVTMKQIVERKKSGVPGAIIRQELARTSTPQEKRRATTQEDRVGAIHAALESQGGGIAVLRAEIGSLRNEIGKLVAMLSLEKRNATTMEAIQRSTLAGKA